ncbi:hypothetical protein GC163_13260 [bacterium]|nr:hypothetical protein [bacterium]
MSLASYSLIVEADDGSWRYDPPSGSLTLTTNFVNIEDNEGTYESTALFLRFSGINIDPASITSANLTLIANTTRSGTMGVKVWGIDLDNPSAPASAAAATAYRSNYTTAYVTDTIGATTSGTAWTVDVTDIIRELFESYTFDGKSLMLYVEPNDTPNRSRVFYAAGSGSPPVLDINYSTGGGTTYDEVAEGGLVAGGQTLLSTDVVASGGVLAGGAAVDTFQHYEFASATITATSTATANAVRIRPISSTIDATSTAAAAALRIRKAESTIIGQATASAAIQVSYRNTGAGGMVAGGTSRLTRRLKTSGTITAVADVTGYATAIYDQQTTGAALASGQATAQVTHQPTATVAAVATVTVSAINREAIEVSATVSAVSEMLVTVGYLVPTASSLVGTSSATAHASKRLTAQTTIEALETVSAVAHRTRNTSAMFTTFVMSEAETTRTRNTAATITGTSTKTADAVFLINCAATVSVTSTGEVSAHRTASGSASVTGSSTTEATAARITPASATVAGLSDAESFARAIYSGSADITNFVISEAHARADYQTAATITCQSVTQVTSIYRPTTLPDQIYNWLSDQLSVALYPLVLPRNVTLPAITYGRRATEFVYYLDQPSTQRITTLGFDIFARSQAEAINLTAELVEALHDYRGNIGNTIVSHAELISLDDTVFDDAGENHQGIIRSLDFEIIHNHRRDVTATVWTGDTDLAEYLQDFTAQQVTMVPDLTDSRPLITVTREGTGLETYIGNTRPYTDADYTIRIDSTSYATTLALADTLRRSLGNQVDDESDTFDFTSDNQPLYRTELAISFS